ncbi:MAG: hypothetical protein A9Z00_06475 [Thermobacillus sp. ZCTH02-B1]|uniref:hypothetical protein n=1 Tax=Thermobacillus sp. ZCTH02-B1 TaxID=1858795 RepID=UPI000B569D14|nr:hypothetical protein [Thermobacillus sp. ZCTH02-B1]OUM95999.1 MAG: hypothetical protein A9Z00_06475 [Thermobacillus sp. ZCTH02-B1]
MRRPWQYALLGAAVTVFILYGIEMASDGIEDVYGPPKPGANRAVDAGGAGGYGHTIDPYGIRGGDPYGDWSDGAYGRASGPDGVSGPGTAYGPDGETGPGAAYDSGGTAGRDRYGAAPGEPGYGGYGYGDAGDRGGGTGRLADGAAGLLQSAAKGGIRFIVSLFESVTD